MRRYSRYSRYGRYGRYRSYYSRRGNPWSAVAVLVAVLLFGLMCAFAFFNQKLSAALDVLAKGGELYYDQAAMQTYAQEQYDAYFAGVPHEDNIMIVVFADQRGNDYRVHVVTGAHVRSIVADYFGNSQYLHKEYEDEDINPVPLEKKITNILTNLISLADSKFSRPNFYESILFCNEKKAEDEIHSVTNYTEVPVKNASVERYLKQFATGGLSVSVVIVDADQVLDRYIPTDVAITVGILIAIIAALVIVLLILYKFRRRLFPEKAEVEHKETAVDHDKLDEEYWKNRY